MSPYGCGTLLPLTAAYLTQKLLRIKTDKIINNINNNQVINYDSLDAIPEHATDILIESPNWAWWWLIAWDDTQSNSVSNFWQYCCITNYISCICTCSWIIRIRLTECRCEVVTRVGNGCRTRSLRCSSHQSCPARSYEISI